MSAAPYDALNLALHVDDEPRNVLANRGLLGREFGGEWVNFPQQVHGAAVSVVDASHAGRRQVVHGGANGSDALVTRERSVPIGILVADCLPVLFADAEHGVVGAAHAGRVGLSAGVLSATVTAMAALGADIETMTVVIGPSVCGRCYEVPEAMRDEVEAVVPGSAAVTRSGTASLDLAAGAAALLSKLGIGTVRRTDVCTAEDDRFYSYRRDGVTGRFAGVVMLNPDG